MSNSLSAGQVRGHERLLSIPLLLLGGFLAVGGVAASIVPVIYVVPVVSAAILLLLTHRLLLSWPSLLVLTLLVIMFIPIRTYRMPINLPIELEPYRLLVAFLIMGWLASLLVDPKTRLRRSGFEAPLGLFVVAVLASIVVNQSRIRPVEAEVVKEVSFLASFLLLFYLIVSVVRETNTSDMLVKVLVGSGAVVAGLALVESRTGYNVFSHLADVAPLLELAEDRQLARGGKVRVFGSAQHPIGLGAALVMLIPFAIYLVWRCGRRWLVAGGLLGLGALATVSRTSVLMLVVVAAMFLWLRPLHTKRLWPLLLPALVVVHLALPGTLGTLKKSFFPEGGLIQQQQQGAGSRGSGRIADLGPALTEYQRRPLVGQGYGSRVVDKERANANILDNQWLGTLLETGAVGAFAWLWVFARTVTRFGRTARADPAGHEGWLLTAATASIVAFAVGMLTFDAFSLIQATFLLYVLLALGAVAQARFHGAAVVMSVEHTT